MLTLEITVEYCGFEDVGKYRLDENLLLFLLLNQQAVSGYYQCDSIFRGLTQLYPLFL